MTDEISTLDILLELDSLSDEGAFYMNIWDGSTALIDRATFDVQGKPIQVLVRVAPNGYDYYGSFESQSPPSEPAHPTSKFSQTFTVDDLPCPDCGQFRIIGHYFTNEKDEHMHTRYVCTFWRSGVKPDLSAALHEPCGWLGASVPGWDK